MKGELENGTTFDVTPQWLREWEAENGVRGRVGMTLDEAIKELDRISSYLQGDGRPIEQDALRLGISALVRIKTLRKENGAACYPLVGEIDDESLPAQEMPE